MRWLRADLLIQDHLFKTKFSPEALRASVELPLKAAEVQQQPHSNTRVALHLGHSISWSQM
jgi:hypothetical protein